MVRIKHRFVVAQLLWNFGTKEKFNELTIKDLQTVLKEKIIELFGDVGVGDFGSSTLIKYLEGDHSKIFVVKTTREGEHHVRFALACINKIKDVDLSIRTLTVKSCPRTCREALLETLSLFFETAGSKIPDGAGKLESVKESLQIVDL